MGTALYNAMVAIATWEILRSLTAWTESRSQTRMSGGVGGVEAQSRHLDLIRLCLGRGSSPSMTSPRGTNDIA